MVSICTSYFSQKPVPWQLPCNSTNALLATQKEVKRSGGVTSKLHGFSRLGPVDRPATSRRIQHQLYPDTNGYASLKRSDSVRLTFGPHNRRKNYIPIPTSHTTATAPSAPSAPSLPDACDDDSPCSSMTGSRPSHSRENSASNRHRPLQPSALRQSHTPPVRRAHSQGNEAASRRPMVEGESAPLLSKDGQRCGAGAGADHGTFSSRPSSPTSGLGPGGSAGSVVSLESALSHQGGTDDWKRWLKARMRTKKMDHSSQLAMQAGFRFTPLM